MEKPKEKKLKSFLKVILIIFCIIPVISVVWVVFSLVGRIDANTVIPESVSVHVSVPNMLHFLDGVLAHEPLNEISAVPALAKMAVILNTLNESPFLKNKFLRLAARGKLGFALLPSEPGKTTIIAGYDLGLLYPLLRILPAVSGFINIPGLYYVQAGKNSRFEFRTDDMTFYIGAYRNLLFITNNSIIYESRYKTKSADVNNFNHIKPSAYDTAILISREYITSLFSEQDPKIASILENINLDSMLEAGLSIDNRRFEFDLSANVSSGKTVFNRFIEQRSLSPDMAERLPASAQYATILSDGTLNELYQAAVVFSPDMDDMIKKADSSARTVLGLTLDDLLFSWSGKEFAVFGLEGRPHPVFAIQVSDERKRKEIFDKAFKSVFLTEDIRLNLDGTRIPRISTPEFFQALLRRWNIFLPSPYYTVYKDFILVSESADTLLSALRAMQGNDVLVRTASWREIADGKAASSSFSLYYSLDLSIPFFMRKNTALSGFLSLYRQGLARISFDRGIINFSLSLVPGSGNGVTLVSGYPLDIGGKPSNQIFGSGKGADSRIFFISDSAAVSVNLADNSISELSGQSARWVIPAEGVGKKDDIYAWVVSDRGRVTLVDESMEPAQGFPVITGLRLSAPPYEFEGKLYLCDEGGKIHFIDEKRNLDTWETSFTTALRSPPSFLTVSGKGKNRSAAANINYAAVYPKSFFGEIWLLNVDGKVFPNWPASVSLTNNTGVGFGSPLLFAHNNNVYTAFVCQNGELVVYDENAVPVSPFPLFLDGVFYMQPVFDGEYMWLVSSNGTFFRISIEGELLYQSIPGFPVMEEGYITTFDCDGDKTPEIFITGEGNALYAFTRNFRSLEGFPLPVWGRPYFIEAKNSSNGKRAEVIGMGMDMKLYRWQFNQNK